MLREILTALLVLFLASAQLDRPDQNQPPIANADTYTVHGFMSPLSPQVTANDYDPDGDPIFVTTVLATTQHGGLSRLTGNDFSYLPAPGYVGPDSFTYQVCDNMGACSSAVVTFNVVNEPPQASNDSYFVHGLTIIGPLLANDSDPDGDALIFSGIVLFPEHGILSGLTSDTFHYRPDDFFIGVDTFTYRVCDEYQLCSVATVFLDVNNNPPVAVGESYTVHGTTTIGPLLENDFDPDGDQLFYTHVTGASHGTVFGLTEDDMKSYVPDYGYVGPDSFTYKVCDEYFACSEPVEVMLNVVNNPPIAGDDHYFVNGTTTIGPLRLNDSDPDDDTLGEPAIIVGPKHGSLFGLSDPDLKSYGPGEDFNGHDSFIYQICDHLGACSTATVTLSVNSEDDAEDFGEVCPNQRVGGPINVTNGNMYLQQEDYQLPGLGVPISIVRTYNSMSQRSGIFGRGWSTIFDESLIIQGTNSLRLYSPDGRATNFRRNESGVFLPAEGDFHGSISLNLDGTFSLTNKSGFVDLFSASGKLLHKTDRHGNQTSLIYENETLSSVNDATGRTVRFSINANGFVESAEDELGEIASYEYGINNELLSVKYPDGSGYQFTYVFSPQPVLGTVKDMLGNILEAHTYDEHGRAISFEKHGGVERVTLNYVDASRTDVTDSLGRVTRYLLDKSGVRNVVTSVEGACNCSGGAEKKSWTYDSQLNILSFSNSGNLTTHYTYDADGNELTMTDSSGTSYVTYNHLGQVLTSTDVMGGITNRTYDAQGNLLSITDAQNNTMSFTYDSRGLLLSMTDALSKVTRFNYDNHGKLIEKIDQLGSVTKFGYDVRGRLTNARDPLTNTTTYSYDAAGRLNKITKADGSTVILKHDLAGRLTEVIDSRNNSTRFEYDKSYRLISRTNAIGKVKRFFYDAASNLVAQSNELGHILDFEYDDLDRLVKVIYPAAAPNHERLEETIAYDTLGNVVKHIDRSGRVTTFQYDDANRLTSITDPERRITQYEYNPRSNVVAVVDPLKQRYGFEYDDLGHIIKVTRAGLSMSFTYDGVGNLTSRTDYNGRTTSYSYDELNRPTTMTYPDGSTTSYSYDLLSRLVRASNVNGTVSFDYDQLGRVRKTVDTLGQVISYTYDPNDNRLRMVPGSGPAVGYEYDSLNRVARIVDGEGQSVTYSYDAASRLIARLLPNDVATHYEYDGLGRLTRLKETKANRVLADSHYSYDAMDNIVQIMDSTRARQYAYDDRDRLVWASNPRTANELYSYDGVGNRTSSHLSSIYQYQPFNRLTATSTASYLYDANGNMLSRTDGDGTTQFKWDFEDRLVQAVMPSGVTVNYRYDALGRLIQRTTTGGFTTNFKLDGDDVIQDRHSLGLTTEYLNGPGIDNKIGQKNILGSFYFMQDHLGSIVGLTDKKGKVVEQVSYDSFGTGTGSSRTHYGFTGRERDPLTGLLYYRARWYDAQLGRFISEDPIGLGGGVNSYAYVGNNPVKRKDPWGLYEIDVHYYLTYYLAIKTGCFNDREARLIANGNQNVDDNPVTSPGPGWEKRPYDPTHMIIWSTAPDYRQQQRNIENHALNRGDNVAHLVRLWTNAVRGNGNLTALGEYLHYLQDIFSHVGFTNPNHGHGLALHSPDKTFNNVRKSQTMVAATWTALSDYSKEKKCGCRAKWTPDMWPTLNKFLELPGGWGFEDIADVPGLLDAKIKTLGVPRR